MNAGMAVEADMQLATVRCPKCGRDARSGQQFCVNCGAALPDAQASAQPAVPARRPQAITDRLGRFKADLSARTCRFHLGLALHASGRAGEAVGVFEAALAETGSHPEAADIRTK